ncbi:MAG: TlpA disulfide reductase family protein [Planctomycetota bacterium]
MNFQRAICLVAFSISCFFSGATSTCAATEDMAGVWQASLVIPSDTDEQLVVSFGLELTQSGSDWRGTVFNGEERIEIPSVTKEVDEYEINFTHYDSVITFDYDSEQDELRGNWKKRRGLDRWAEMEFFAVRQAVQGTEDPSPFAGRWAVDFESSSDPAVGIFSAAENGTGVRGTFMTTTGDYRFLAGRVDNGRMELCCFDGAHAFRFEATATDDGKLEGHFWSSDSWHETWTAERNEDAVLPDAFEQTSATGRELGDYLYRDLDGYLTSINDSKFAGKVRLIYVFGSWCPNCHDAAVYFSELEEKYGERGLSILGLAFEHSGNRERDAKQVRLYLERNNASYPVLLAGSSDKAEASRAFSLIDRVRSYPTTLFIDDAGKIQAIHTGFTGPATGEAYDELKSKFEELIESMLEN